MYSLNHWLLFSVFITNIKITQFLNVDKLSENLCVGIMENL